MPYETESRGKERERGGKEKNKGKKEQERQKIRIFVGKFRKQNNMEYTIKIKEGLGDIRFDMPVEEVVERLGEASEVSTMDNAADEPTTILRYGDTLTLIFEGENPILSYIDICDEEATLYGESVMELTEETVEALMAKNGYKEEDDEEEDWGEHRISFNDAKIDFYFEEGELVSTSFGK